VDVAVEQARVIVTDDWTRLAQRRVASALGPEAAREARSRGAPTLCKELAEVAEALLAAKRWATRAVEDTVTPLLGCFGKRRLARVVARQVAKHMVSVPAAKITATAHALRAYGVLVCVLDGRSWLSAGACARWPMPDPESRFEPRSARSSDTVWSPCGSRDAVPAGLAQMRSISVMRVRVRAKM